MAGTRKRADSYFPPEERVQLVRLVSNWVLPGERSGELSVEYSWNKLQICLNHRYLSQNLGHTVLHNDHRLCLILVGRIGKVAVKLTSSDSENISQNKSPKIPFSKYHLTKMKFLLSDAKDFDTRTVFTDLKPRDSFFVNNQLRFRSS